MNRLGQDWDEDHWDEDPADDSAGSGLLGQTLRYAAILLGVGLLISWGLSRVPEMPKLPLQAGANSRAAQRPPAPLPAASQGGYEISVPAGANGHFMLAAMANGTQVDFLVDTGASSVILNLEDAERLGINVHILDFSAAIRTANGEIRGAPVVLRELRVGQFHTDQVPALVISAPLDVSLLGMSFLSRFKSFEMQGNRLILRW